MEDFGCYLQWSVIAVKERKSIPQRQDTFPDTNFYFTCFKCGNCHEEGGIGSAWLRGLK